jgi:hypothetical protein
MSGTLSFSWGDWGGFYYHRGYTTRLCLGYVAITYFPDDIDDYLTDYTQSDN